MKEHFKPKTLSFYAIMIGSVTLLFNLVAAYGEKNLKAPPNFGGRYVSTQAPPGCPDSTQLVLTIQQSGVFLNGLLQLQEASAATATAAGETSSEERLSLSGRWSEQQINLTGTTDAFDACRSPGATYPMPTIVTIQGQVDQLSASQSPQTHTPTTFTGELTIDEPPAWSFTAQRQASEEKQDAH